MKRARKESLCRYLVDILEFESLIRKTAVFYRMALYRLGRVVVNGSRYSWIFICW